MKKFYLLLALAGIFTLIAAFEIAPFSQKAMLPPVADDPFLPDEPYDYDVPFPEWYLENVLWINQNANPINQRITREKATLGRVLFYDKRLSVNNEISCGTCHKQEFSFSDDLRFSNGVDGSQTPRNTPNINEIGWKTSYQPPGYPLFWDARENDLEEMVLMPIVHEGEMGKDLEFLISKLNNTEFYPALFEDAYGDPGITPDRIAESIALFVQSLNLFDTKYDRVLQGEAVFTEQELRGQELFMANCNMCHTAPHFSMLEPSTNSLVSDDPGWAAVTGDSSDFNKFKSPSLRNIALTAPYMHDGRFNTLEKVLVFYSDSIPNVYYGGNISGFNMGAIDFDENEVADLVAFLETLTSETLTTDVRFSDPFQNPNITRQHTMNDAIRVFPNPFSEQTTILFDLNGHETFDFQLRDKAGRLLRSFSSNSESFILERNGLPAGVYFLEIRNGYQSGVKRLVIH